MDRESLNRMSVAKLREVLQSLGASPRGARTKAELIDRILTEIRVRRDLAAIRNGAKP